MHFPEDTIVDSRFRIIRSIRSGGMGAVYLAEQLDLHRHVALKFLLPDVDLEKGFARFRQEAKILNQVSHPNIVAVHCFGQFQNLFYISMEYVDAKSLDDMIFGGRTLPWEELVPLIEQTCSAVSALHAKGIVHRDIKPSNILVTSDGVVKLIDFGLSKPLNPSGELNVTEPGTAVGTVMYMSPEQCVGSGVDERSDIYSIGCVLYHIVAGKPPFSDLNPLKIMNDHVNTTMPKLPARIEKSAVLQTVINRCTRKSPADRYQNVRDIIADLNSDTVDLLDEPTPSRKKPDRKMYLQIAVGAFVVGIAGVAFSSYFEKPEHVGEGLKSDVPLFKLRELTEQQLSSGDPTAAIATSLLAIEKPQSDEDRGKSYENLWHAYMDAKEYKNAIELAKNWCDMRGPQKFGGMTSLAESYRVNGQLKESLETWGKVKSQGGLKGAREMLFYARTLREGGQYKEALEAAQNGLDEDFTHPIGPKPAFGHLSGQPKGILERDRAALIQEIDLDKAALRKKR